MKRIAHKRLLEVGTCPVLAEKYANILMMAEKAYREDNVKVCLDYLSRIPSTDEMYERLLEKLQGKHVLKTLRRIKEGKITEKYTKLKAFSSLFTHVVIECEQGSPEFEILFPVILDKINKLAYQR